MENFGEENFWPQDYSPVVGVRRSELRSARGPRCLLSRCKLAKTTWYLDPHGKKKRYRGSGAQTSALDSGRLGSIPLISCCWICGLNTGLLSESHVPSL